MANDCGACKTARCNGGLTKQALENAVVRLLCDQVDALDTIVTVGIPTAPATGSQATPLPLVRIAYNLVPAAFAVALDDTNQKRYINIYNGTNQPVAISFDAGVTVHEVVDPSTAVVLRYSEAALYQANKVYLKYDSAAPTAGEVRIASMY